MKQVPNPSPTSLPDEVREALQNGNLFEAIKVLRRVGVPNLKEAKAALEAEARRINAGQAGCGGGVGVPSRRMPAAPAAAAGGFPAAATEALRRGNKIAAIRLVSQHRGVSLKEAKDIVEQHEQMVVPTADSLSPGEGLSPGQVPRTGDRLTWVLVAAVVLAGLLYHFVLRDPG